MDNDAIIKLINEAIEDLRNHGFGLSASGLEKVRAEIQKPAATSTNIFYLPGG